jgi:hypothetical protein
MAHLAKQISPVLWNLNVHYCFQKNSLQDPILSQINPVHIITLYYLKVNTDIMNIHSSTPSLPYDLFS